MVLYRHFVKTSDGAICELEEGIPFTVDNYPNLEKWPKQVRKNLATNDSRMVIEQEKEKEAPNTFLFPTFKEGDNTDEPVASPISKRDDGSNFFDPHTKLIKND